jgi:glutamyl-tRNA synthetase
MYDYMGWEYPDAVHTGRLKIQGVNLSKSTMMRGLESGEFDGVDDPRLGTLAALRRRGYLPETIRKVIWEVGPKPVDVTISWDNINSQNRKLIDPTSHRYYYVPDPLNARISGVQKDFVVKAPLHPEHPEMGARLLTVSPKSGVAEVLLAGTDRELLGSATVVRLMGLFNFKPSKVSGGDVDGAFSGEEVREGEHAPIVQWVPQAENLEVDVVMPDKSVRHGRAEKGLGAEAVGAIIQFVRFGFGRIDSKESEGLTVYFAHQ